MINSKIKKIDTAGFTLFVAMIVSSLLLAVGFSISNIILKQLLLSGSGKDSQIAFYAADSGAECVQFWDSKDSTGAPLLGDGPFATSSPTPILGIICGIKTTGVKADIVADNKTSTTTLVIDYSSLSGDYKACALVVVEKGFTTIGPEEVPYTKVTSRGYNSGLAVGGGACDVSNKRTVERGLVVQY